MLPSPLESSRLDVHFLLLRIDDLLATTDYIHIASSHSKIENIDRVGSDMMQFSGKSIIAIAAALLLHPMLVRGARPW